MDKRKKLSIILSLLTVTSSYFAWQSVMNAIIVSNSSTWAVPIALFSIFFILICLDIVVFKNMFQSLVVFFVSFLLSLSFAFAWVQLVAIVVATLLMLVSIRTIRNDIELNIKLSPWKSLQEGKTFLLISLSLVIAMQYYLTISNFNVEKKVPHFDASFITKYVAIPFLSSVSPQFKSLSDETLTVDQFILQSQNLNQTGTSSVLDDQILDAQLPENMSPVQKEMIKEQARKNFSNTQTQVNQKNQELVLIIGRKQFADLMGMSVTGSEKIADVFTGLMTNRLNNYFNPNLSGDKNNSVFSMILAVVLFLIIYPLSILLSIPVFLIAQLVIFAFLKLEYLSVKIVTVEKEVLE